MRRIFLLAATLLAMNACGGGEDLEFRDTRSGAVAVCRAERQPGGMQQIEAQKACANSLQALGFTRLDKELAFQELAMERSRYLLP